jgi:16S rRNA (uracil1498-N3)-methyltransferase
MPYHLHIGIAPTKNVERFEWFLEKATEIGISEITPLLCAHSERKFLRGERMEKIIISAMKQSQKAYKPILHPMTPLKEWVMQSFTGTRIIGYCDQHEPVWIGNVPFDSGITMAIGPEGDFTPEEIDLARNYGFLTVSLGDSRLRTETAGLVCCAWASLLMK